jgi:hypothetical protein
LHWRIVVVHDFDKAMREMIRAVMDENSWVYRSKCLGSDRSFVPSLDEDNRIEDVELLRICNGKDGAPECGVKEECLNYALSARERSGVWGGMTTEQRDRRRRAIAKQERRRRELRIRVSGNRVIVRGQAVI